MKILRKSEQCINCGTCSRKCPSFIDVEKQGAVHSPECIGCMTCVGSCPAEGTLDMSFKLGAKRRVLKPILYPVLLVAFLYLVIGIGMATGNWHSRIPYEEYQRIIPELYR